ncbi:MAG: selenocysteine-specific translation elongation factor [Planctomycetes bacterium]|nr:selenocysteine-specific translation elongation factor [Planctomycetota bacterium]
MKHPPPGFLRQKMDPEVLLMVCTAGHVDHGKTSLVKTLTGCSMDRLKEEQERKLTIELGFAPCVLGSGDVCVGIVDVPGHEKFVKNMVAGVSGIDMTILVVAADDGVMPQTVEHFQILELLGVRHGMVALTKIDRVSRERVAEVNGEIREFLAGSFMEKATICPVSSETWEGFPEFYDALVQEVKGLSRRRSLGVFRMPVLNSFTRQGFGSVVTGIPVDGTIEVGQALELVPGGQKGKLRSLQRFLRDATAGGFGQCLALNIPEFGKTPPERGQVICAPGCLRAWQSLHLRLKVVAGIDRPLKNAEHVKFHTGTSEEYGRLYLLEEKMLGEGQTGLANIVLAAPLAVAVHDKFIIRRPAPAVTVAGGEVIGMSPSAVKASRRQAVARLRTYVEFFQDASLAGAERVEREIEYFLCSEGATGASLREIARGTLLADEAVRETVTRLEEAGRVLRLAPDSIIHRSSYDASLAEAAARVQRHVAEGKVLSLALADLRRGLCWPAALWSRVEEDLAKQGLVSRRGDRVVLESAAGGLNDKDQDLVQRIVATFDEHGFKSPRPDELPDLLRAPEERVERLLDYLCAKKELFRLAKNVVLSRRWLRKAEELVVQVVQEKGVLDSADFKYHIDSTRKYALAILDYLDSRNVTVRRGNDRHLAADYRRNLT